MILVSIKRCCQKNILAANVVAVKENYTRKRGKIREATEKHTNFWVRGRKKFLKSRLGFSFWLFSWFLKKV